MVAAVNKMLAGSDDIIRQHKAACLRITALLAVRDRLWVTIFSYSPQLYRTKEVESKAGLSLCQPNAFFGQVGTSAGVIVTLALPHITAATTKLPSPPPLSGEQIFKNEDDHYLFCLPILIPLFPSNVL